MGDLEGDRVRTPEPCADDGGVNRDPIVFDSWPEPPRTPDGRWDLAGTGWDKDRALAALVGILHKGAPVREPIVFRPEPGEGHPSSWSWQHEVLVPIDHAWVRRTTVLPSYVVLGRYRGHSCVSNGWNLVRTSFGNDDRRWQRAGWRVGEPYDGPVPLPRASWWRRVSREGS